LRVAYYSPLPPERSGVADFSALLLPALRQRVDVVVARRRTWRRAPRADVHLYHLGNDPTAHGWILASLRRRPGIVVLHEVALHELVASLTLGRGDRSAYLDAVERDGGVVGRLLAYGALEGLLPPLWETRPLTFPLIASVLEQARGVIVHSRLGEERVLATGYGGAVRRIPLPAWRPPVQGGVAPFRPNRFPVIVSAGGLNRAKRIPQLLEAFARIRARFPDALLVLAGPGGDGLQLEARLERVRLVRGRDVQCLGYVSERELWSLLGRADIFVGLRWPTLGEASSIVLRALASGTAVVVSEAGWFSELPDAVAAKVPVDEHEVEMLAALIELLAGNERLRAGLASSARAYLEHHHDVEDVADAYASAVREVAAGLARETQVEQPPSGRRRIAG
jgi:glycosyltransferase involved in cell wall biosynthesis